MDHLDRAAGTSSRSRSERAVTSEGRLLNSESPTRRRCVPLGSNVVIVRRSRFAKFYDRSSLPSQRRSRSRSSDRRRRRAPRSSRDPRARRFRPDRTRPPRHARARPGRTSSFAVCLSSTSTPAPPSTAISARAIATRGHTFPVGGGSTSLPDGPDRRPIGRYTSHQRLRQKSVDLEGVRLHPPIGTSSAAVRAGRLRRQDTPPVGDEVRVVVRRLAGGTPGCRVFEKSRRAQPPGSVLQNRAVVARLEVKWQCRLGLGAVSGVRAASGPSDGDRSE